MKNVTVDEFLRLRPCYGEARIREIAGAKESFTALDVLAMSEIPAGDRLWAVLREEFIDAPILHEFARRCAEQALSLIDNPDPRSVAAIEAKRAWVRGEISDKQLAAARAAARAAADAADAAWAAARAAAWDAAWDAASAAERAAAWAAASAAERAAASDAASAAARAAASDAASAAASAAASDAASAAASAAARAAAWDAAWDAARAVQIEMLKKMLMSA